MCSCMGRWGCCGRRRELPQEPHPRGWRQTITIQEQPDGALVVYYPSVEARDGYRSAAVLRPGTVAHGVLEALLERLKAGAR